MSGVQVGAQLGLQWDVRVWGSGLRLRWKIINMESPAPMLFEARGQGGVETGKGSGSRVRALSLRALMTGGQQEGIRTGVDAGEEE